MKGRGQGVGRDDGLVWLGGMACSCLVAMRTGSLGVILGVLLWRVITVPMGWVWFEGCLVLFSAMVLMILDAHFWFVSGVACVPSASLL